MRRRLLDPVRDAARASRTALAEPDLTRLLAAWLAINAGKYAFLVANLVIVYEAGGAVGVGIMGLAQYLTPMILAPMAGLPAARWPPDRVLAGVNAVRTLAVAMACLVIALGLPIELLYAAIALEAGAGAFTRPLHNGLMPAVSRTPEELVAANVSTSAAEGLGTFLGPALAGILLVLSGPLGATILVLVIYALGLIPIARLRIPVVGQRDSSVRASLDHLAAGVRTAATSSGPRLVLIGIAMQTFVRGILTTLTVAAAVELLGMGDPGVGALNAAIGIGGLIGAGGAFALAGRPRLVPAFTLALAAWGAPIAVIGLVAEPGIALAMMVAIGVANAILDVSGFTLAQRTTPNDRRVAFLGLVDSAANGGIALGAIAAPVLLAVLPLREALVVTGLILPVTAVAMWPFLRRVPEDGVVDQGQAALLRTVPLFAPLSLATLEHLAGAMTPVTFREGEALMVEGEAGDRFIVVDTGVAEIRQGGRLVRVVRHGEGAGEIAMLRDVPRTATVVATEPIEGFALDRASFLEAVTGSPRSFRVATTVVDARLEGDASAAVGGG